MACEPRHRDSVRRLSLSHFTDAEPSAIAHVDTPGCHGTETLNYRASEPTDMLPNKFHRTNAGTVAAADLSSHPRHYASPMAYCHLAHQPPMPPYEVMNTALMQAEAALSSSSAPEFQHFDIRSSSISPPVDFGDYAQDYHSDAVRFHGVDNESFGPTEMYPGLPLYNMVRSGAAITPPPSNFSVPLSPQSNAEWPSMANPGGRFPNFPKRVRMESFSRLTPVLRSDGVRKKNARFDIPPGRTVETIDDLIDKANDDTLIKELKTQKRLLRNREAAYDSPLQSRQKKKVHTERLEEEKKYFTNVISRLEEDVAALTTQIKQHEHQKKEWIYLQAEADQRLQHIQFEKQEMAKTYANDSRELRAQIVMLQESLRNARSSPMSTVPSSTDYSDFASDMNHMGFDHAEWEGFGLANDFCLDSGTAWRQQEAPSLSVDTKQLFRQSTATVDTSVASNLLLTLLLCGAHAASTSHTCLPVFRHLPTHIRSAATLVLHSVLENTTIAPELHPQFLKPRHKFSDFVSDSSYVMPNLKQEEGIISSFDGNDGSTPLGYRSDLVAAFATLRQDANDGLAADIYAQRVTWSEISPNVVSEFRAMIQ